MKRLFIVLAFGCLLLIVHAGSVRAATAATFSVNQTADLVDANVADNHCDTDLSQAGDQCSLRAAVQQANAHSGTDTISFVSSAVHKLTRAGIDNTANAGDLDIVDSVILRGRAPGTTIDGGGLDRVFNIFGQNSVTFEDLVIRGGRLTTNNLVSAGVEGVFGDLTFDNVTLTDNIVTGVAPPGFSGPCCNGVADILCNCAVTFTDSASLSAGFTDGIVADRVNITDSQIRNHGQIGIIVDSGSSTISRSVISANMGGVSNAGANLLIRDSEISGGTGGTWLYEVLYTGHGVQTTGAGAITNIVNSTISGNKTASEGGGISNSGTVKLFNTTIANNSTIQICDSLVLCSGGSGGGIVNHGTLELTNTIVANNADNSTTDGVHPDCSGTLASNGFNLLGSTTGCTVTGNTTGNLLNVSPLLNALANNGGPTRTHSLQVGSPAIDAGNPAGCPDQNGAIPTTDQRGFPRPQDGNGDTIATCDMGAFETGAVGIGFVSPHKGSSAPGTAVQFDVTWDSPTRWRDLDTVDLRFKRHKEILLWLRFTEGLPSSTFSLLDQDGNIVDSGTVGEAKTLKNKYGSLALASSGFTASGPDDPHVVLHYKVKFKKAALGKLKMQLLAADDFANTQGPEPAGVWNVKQ